MKALKIFLLVVFSTPVLAQNSYGQHFGRSDLFWLLIIILAIALFFLVREISTWYWKIDKRIELLKKQNEILQDIFIKLGGGLDGSKEGEDN